jgi:hypothetical protein
VAHYLKTIVEELNQLIVSVVVVIRIHIGIVPPGSGGRFGDERIEVAGIELLVCGERAIEIALLLGPH